MSEIELIYWFFKNHKGVVIDYPDADDFWVGAEDERGIMQYTWAATIGDAIRQWKDEYESKAKP